MHLWELTFAQLPSRCGHGGGGGRRGSQSKLTLAYPIDWGSSSPVLTEV